MMEAGKMMRLRQIVMGEIRFVPAESRGEGVSGFVLRAADAEHAGTTTICNCRFNLLT